jgi:hypothetical protein
MAFGWCALELLPHSGERRWCSGPSPWDALGLLDMLRRRWRSTTRFTLWAGALASSVLLAGRSARADDAPITLRISRTQQAIEVDGVLDDAGWRDLPSIDTWYETKPGNNIPPPVRSRARLAYDDAFLYVAFEFDDPDPERIRAPLGDRDNLSNDTDYGGIMIDPTNRGRSALEFLANARGVQFDAVQDDTTGAEDSAPDFFWDAAGRVTKRGWQLELKIPFSSLSYSHLEQQTWRVILYRNYPRDFRYQFFSSRLPRGTNCFVCSFDSLAGLSHLPTGGGVVVAPYVSASFDAAPEGQLGSRLDRKPPKLNVGFDSKWRPNAGTVVDLTVNPDFSQVESDTAQVGANERFALFYPEKRPFFLEGVDLFGGASSDQSDASSARTPLQPVYTRTLTDPEWGIRGTGKVGAFAYSSMVVQDHGGGQVVVPGSASSGLAQQDFRSWAGIWRLRYELGQSFVAVSSTAREIFGGGYNLLAGPDFQWRPNQSDSATGQFLLSATRTPDKPELATEWDGRSLNGEAGELRLRHVDEALDGLAVLRDVSTGFRAYNGFITRVGYREAYGEGGYTVRPDAGILRSLRALGIVDHAVGRDGDLLFQQLAAGAELEGTWSSSLSLRYVFDRIRTGSALLPQHQLVFDLDISPPGLARIQLSGSLGRQIDVDNARRGLGSDLGMGLLVRPTPHLEVRFDGGLRWLYVDEPDEPLRWLFTAHVERMRLTYMFTPHLFLRAIIQYQGTTRATGLYASAVAREEALLTGSFLLAWKLNWQSVLFLGYGDERAYLPARGSLEPAAQQLFIKASYAFQR